MSLVHSLGGEEGDSELVFDASVLEEGKRERVKLAINDYINERAKIIEDAQMSSLEGAR